MARWLLIPTIIFFAMLNPTIAIFDLDGLMSIVNSAIRLGAGGLKFLQEYLAFNKKELPDTTPSNQEEYDFIIVGAGSAGATLASRLSEIKQAKVLLLEAGDHENLIMDIPIAALYLQFDSNLHWDYLAEQSNNYCLSMVDQRCRIPYGKVVGGSSSINMMIATRGNKNDYDEWAKLTGDDSWSYNGMLKYFKKLEKCDVTRANVDPKYRDFNGPIRITNAEYKTPLADAFVKAGAEIGLPPLDYNGRKQTGFSYLQTNQINGERLSTNRAYLHPAKKRRNLSISFNSHVNKVLINPKTKRACGVEFTKQNKKIQVIARKEVILCAGALGSPKLLMLSGIGPAQHLQSLSIDVLKDAPVGENLIDHAAYFGLSFPVNESVSIVVPEFLIPSNPAIGDYLTKRTGPIATPLVLEGLGFINVDDPKPENENPNIELLFGGASFGADYLFHVAFGLSDEYWQKFFSSMLFQHGYLIWPILLHPKSRGKVLLRSADPTASPKIHANYYSDPEDVRVMIKGIRMAIELSKTKALQRYDAKLLDRKVPGCENHVPDSDAYWECALKRFTMTVWHFCGTCKMGRENDESAVVNTKLQVKGIKNLRIGDASIMPRSVAAHLNIPTIAVSEKLADIIKSDWY